MAHSLFGLYLAYALGGIGAGAVYGSSVGTALKWFPDRRGLAAGATAGAYGFGTALTVIPINRMIQHNGYQFAFITWGIIQGIVVLIAAQFVRSPQHGWRPAGWVEATPRAVVRSQQSDLSYTPLQMVQTGRFWIMFLMMGLVAFGGLMVTAQLKPIAHYYHLESHIVLFGITAVAMALVLDRVLNGLTRPFWGWISDHIGRYNTMAIASGPPSHLVHCPHRLDVLRLGGDLLSIPRHDRRPLRSGVRHDELRDRVHGQGVRGDLRGLGRGEADGDFGVLDPHILGGGRL
jgi:OFA family oxalate/formate antiporter-like MFS transporter